MKSNAESFESTYHTAESLGIKAIERPASERAGFPRYIVLADSKTYMVERPAALRRILCCIRAPAPVVFRNAGKGITIDFDRV